MRSRLLVTVAAAALLVLAGCGDKTDYIRIATTEGTSVDVGDLVYQVQISRYLNPSDIEDREYLVGVPTNEPVLTGDQTWFGVFIRVKNYTDESQQPTTQMVIKDTEGNEFFPIKLPTSNVFAYNPSRLPAHQVLPNPDTAAASGPIQGSLILFKLKTDSLQNRPLELRIKRGGSPVTAVVDLDV